MAKVLIVGFPYVRERYFATFRYYEKVEDLLFLLPKKWQVKNGKVIYEAPEDKNILTTKAYFHHSNYPIIGGILKGIMPSFPLHLWRHRRNIKLVYSCSEPTLLTTLYYGFFAKIFGKKHIFFSWENIDYKNKFSGINLFIKLLIIKINFYFSNGIICGNKKSLIIHEKFKPKYAEIIPMNGLDTEVFKPEKKHTKDYISFVFVGAIDKRKGLDVLIRAFARVNGVLTNTKLTIAGSGDSEREIDVLISENGIETSVQKMPWIGQKELLELLSCSDVFMYPSVSTSGWEEQFGYSMAEASLMELPVISTNTGSIEDVVIDGKTGILVEEKNEDELFEAMLKLTRDPELRYEMGIAGRKYISENFSHKIISNKYKDFFDSIIRA